MNTPANFEEIRAKAMEIGQRAKSDATFLSQLQADPVATLRAAGLPEEGIPAFLREEGLEAEVSGYSIHEDSWCVCSYCCYTGSAA